MRGKMLVKVFSEIYRRRYYNMHYIQYNIRYYNTIYLRLYMCTHRIRGGPFRAISRETPAVSHHIRYTYTLARLYIYTRMYAYYCTFTYA